MFTRELTKGRSSFGTTMTVEYKLYLDRNGKRLDDFNRGYWGIMSRVKDDMIVVCAVDSNVFVSGYVYVAVVPDEEAYEASVKWGAETDFFACYAISKRVAKKLRLI